MFDSEQTKSYIWIYKHGEEEEFPGEYAGYARLTTRKYNVEPFKYERALFHTPDHQTARKLAAGYNVDEGYIFYNV